MSGVHATFLGGGTSGGGSGSVTLDNQSVSSIGAGDRAAGYQINANGSVYTLRQATYTVRHQWTPDATTNYQVRATVTSGDVSTGTTGSWVSTTAEWTVVSTSPGFGESAQLLIEVRDAVSLEVKASCTVTLYAEEL